MRLKLFVSESLKKIKTKIWRIRIGKEVESGYDHWTKRNQNATMFMV